VLRGRWFAALVVLLGLAVAIGRVGVGTIAPTRPVSAHWVMTDFYSSAYYPVRALLDGENPHDSKRFRARYPAADRYPPYLPVNLIIHLPFGLLPPRAAGLAYFLVTIGLFFALGWAALRLSGAPPTLPLVCLVVGLLLLSRPGQWTLLLGQQSVLLSLLVYATIVLADRRPGWSALALAVVSYKPTFGLPLGLILLLSGRARVAFTGAAIAIILNAPLLLVLIEQAGGLAALLGDISAGYQEWQLLPVANPATSPWLVDAPSLVSRFLNAAMPLTAQIVLGLAILGVAAMAVRRLRWDEGVERNLAIGVISTALLSSAHHVGYDMVLLTAPAVALAFGKMPATMSPALRLLFILAYLLPALNWISTHGALRVLNLPRGIWLLVTAVNSICLLALLAGFISLAFSVRAQPNGRSNHGMVS
jgi:hypothetical protein